MRDLIINQGLVAPLSVPPFKQTHNLIVFCYKIFILTYQYLPHQKKHQETVSKRVDEMRDKNRLEFFLELLSFVVCDA